MNKYLIYSFIFGLAAATNVALADQDSAPMQLPGASPSQSTDSSSGLLKQMQQATDDSEKSLDDSKYDKFSHDWDNDDSTNYDDQ